MRLASLRSYLRQKRLEDERDRRPEELVRHRLRIRELLEREAVAERVDDRAHPLGEARRKLDAEIARTLLDQLRERLPEGCQARCVPAAKLGVADRIRPELDHEGERV